jgi:ParB family chromosome partitioning protein
MMSGKKDFAAMDPRHGQTTSAAAQALRRRSGNPSSIPLSELQPNPDNPRYGYDDPETRELAETLRSAGQAQAATVIPRENYLAAYPDRHDELGPQPWVVIVGNRRLAASHAQPELGPDEPALPARASLDVRVNRELTTAQAIEDLILIENIQRKDLPPLKEAEVLQRRLNRPGETARSVGKAIGKSHAYVLQRVSLLRLIPPFQDLLRTGALDIKTGRLLGARSEEEQRAVLDAGEPYQLLRSTPSGNGQHSPPAGNRVSMDGPHAALAAAATAGDADTPEPAQPHEAGNPVSSSVQTADRPASDITTNAHADPDVEPASGIADVGETQASADPDGAPRSGAPTPDAHVVAAARVTIATSLRTALLDLDKIGPDVLPPAQRQMIVNVRSTIEQALTELGAR